MKPTREELQALSLKVTEEMLKDPNMKGVPMWQVPAVVLNRFVDAVYDRYFCDDELCATPTTVEKEQKPSLWAVLEDAYYAVWKDGSDNRPAVAAQIRAFADWLVPESSCRPYVQTLYHEGGADTRLRLRNELLAEVERTKRGE